jgi:hypothetical protein
MIEMVVETRAKIGIGMGIGMGIGAGAADWRRSEAGTDFTEIVDTLPEERGAGMMTDT